ncbi:MAG: hypothetical protein HY231_01560 [Acidobacteria bacterium]|nr:hypothetical protein [Acidobacteriota bacterium]
MAEIKGTLLTAWVNYLKAHYGAPALAEALPSLSAEDQALVATPFLASSWYPYETLNALRKLTRQLVTSPDKNLSIEIGRAMAEYVFTGAYRSLLAKTPAKQVEKITWIKDFFFKDSLLLEIESLSEISCLVRYDYGAGARPARSICESLGGFWSKTLELAGATAIKVQHEKCAAKGATCCEFIFTW